MKNRIFKTLKKIYKRLPINYKTKSRLKSMFYRVFGFAFKNVSSYRVWQSMNNKIQMQDVVKADEAKVHGFSTSKKIAVHLHLFYLDLTEEFVEYFNHIPYKFDILVSVVDDRAVDSVKSAFSKVKNVDSVIVKAVPNRGRDVAPLVVSFAKEILKYDYFCHVHSKKSLYKGTEQTGWRQYLLDGLMADEKRVKTNLYMLEKGDNVGLLYPETYREMPYWGHTWLQNKHSGRELLELMGVEYESGDIYLDFPIGTMFWAKTSALHQFFEGGISLNDFPKEGGQTDGTIAHAFERCLGLVCRANGQNILVLDTDKNTYAYNFGNKNLNQYTYKSYDGMKKELSGYDVISFDIFDTLLVRSISNHHAIIDLVMKKVDAILGRESSFASLRMDAEHSFRNTHPDEDADIDDIYDTLAKMNKFSEEELAKIKDIEVETEIDLISPKKEMVALLKYLKHELKKEIYIISDMQLRTKDIERILEKCGITKEDYDELLLSSAMNMRKDHGDMWDYYAGRMSGKQVIHVGDNEVSDMQMPGDRKLAAYHVLSSKALYQLSSLGRSTGSVYDELAEEAVMQGLIYRKSFADPFAYNASSLNVGFNDAGEYGYSVIGPVILSYLLWLVEEAKKTGSSEILFLAREGHILKAAYEALSEGATEAGIEGLPCGKYLYVSRRALSMAAVETEEDVAGMLEIYYEGKLNNLLDERLGLKCTGLKDDDIKLPDEKNKVMRLIKPYMAGILEKAKKERENYIKYYADVVSDKSNKPIISDIGYAGTIQYYLSKVTGDTYLGRYMATDASLKALQIEGNDMKGFYADRDSEQELSESAVHRYHLLLESIMISPEKQLLSIDDNLKPVFAGEDSINPNYTDVIAKIHSGILEYAGDYAKVMSTALFARVPDKTLPEELIRANMEKDIISDEIRSSLVVDDKYCGSAQRNVIERNA